MTLDSKKLKTPNGAIFSINSEPLALAVAHEWNSQKTEVVMSQMHLTGLCNVSIDNPTNTTKYALVDSVLNFLDTDTILFFTDVSFLPQWLLSGCVLIRCSSARADQLCFDSEYNIIDAL